MKPKIAFVSYGGGHINIVLPIVDRCNKAGFDVDLIALTGANPHATGLGFQTLGYADFIPLSQKKRIIELGKTLFDQNFNAESGITIDESLCYLGVNWAENLERYGKSFANELYHKIGRHSFLPITFFENVIRQQNYQLIVTTNSPKSERAALIAANKRKIPCIRIEDLFFDDNLQEELIHKLGESYSTSIGQFYSSPTKICVMSEYAKSFYDDKKTKMLLKTHPDDVIVTGQPILDRLVEFELPDIEYVSREENQSKSQIVWFHQNNTLDEDSVLTLLSNWFKSKAKTNDHLVIKFHPDASAEQKTKVISCFSAYNHAFTIAKDNENIFELIVKSGVVMAQESTTMLETFFIGKPSICLDPLSIRKNIPYVLSGASKRVVTVDELNAAIAASFSFGSDNMKMIKQKMRFKTNATENIFNMINEMIA